MNDKDKASVKLRNKVLCVSERARVRASACVPACDVYVCWDLLEHPQRIRAQIKSMAALLWHLRAHLYHTAGRAGLLVVPGNANNWGDLAARFTACEEAKFSGRMVSLLASASSLGLSKVYLSLIPQILNPEPMCPPPPRTVLDWAASPSGPAAPSDMRCGVLCSFCLPVCGKGRGRGGLAKKAEKGKVRGGGGIQRRCSLARRVATRHKYTHDEMCVVAGAFGR